LIRNDLEKIVGNKIIQAVDSMMKRNNEEHSEYTDETLYYCLATHLAATYERLMQNKSIHNPQLKEIKAEYPEKYAVAKEMGEIASRYLNIQLPEDEIAFIAMYLKAYSEKSDLINKYVGVVVLSHGHVAEAMVNVASRLLGENHACAMEMSFDESPQQALDRAEEIVKKADLGKGVLLLVDMGSLVGFGKIISEKTGIPIRTCTRVDTLMVIEATRKSMLPDASLDEIADSLEKDTYNYEFQILEEKRKSEAKPVIIFICLTGEGTAKALMENVRSRMPQLDEKVEMICMGSLSQDVSRDIHKILHEKNIIAAIGTFNLKIKDVPFISATELISGMGFQILKNIVNEKIENCETKEEKVELNKLIRDELIFVDLNEKNKDKLLDKVLDKMEKLGYVTSNYKSSVFEREEIAPTLLNEFIAIPHGNPSEVRKQGIAIIKLNKPIKWFGSKGVEIIFLLALKEYDREEFRKLYKFASDIKNVESIKLCKTRGDIKEVFLGEN
jgi:transcriptional regulatory protein LevR